MKRVLSRVGSLTALSLSLTPLATTSYAAEAVAPPVMYPANLWQGRGEAVIRVLNRTDSHIETITIPVGGQAQYRSLHLGVTRCVERPETLPRDAAALITTSDETEPGAYYTGWILAEEPSLNTYKSALYNITIIACSGPNTDPALAPLPQPTVPSLTSTTPTGAQNQSGDLNTASDGASSSQAQPEALPTNGTGSDDTSPDHASRHPNANSGGPTRLAPLDDPSGVAHALTVPPGNTPPHQSLPQNPSSPGAVHDAPGGPMQLAPLSDSSGTGSGPSLAPPQPYGH